MYNNRTNDKIKMPLLRFVPVFVVGALLIAAVIQAFGSPSTVAAQADTTSPTVSSIAITSDPDDDIDEDVPYWADGTLHYFRPSGIYGIGDDIEVTVTFNEDVTVSGSPKLDLKIGRRTETADFSKVEGAAVVFSYTVAEGDSDTDGVAIDANDLRLNGGSIRDDAANDADLTHDALVAQADHEVDGIRPRMPLEIMNVGTIHGYKGFKSAGDLIMVRIKSVPSDLDPAYPGVTSDAPGSGVPGLPQLTLDFDGEERVAEWSDGNHLGLMFWYEIQEGDLDADGVAIKANSISLNGGFLKDQAGNDAILTHAAVPASSSAIVDAVSPSVSSIAITSDPGEDDTYDTGDRVEVTVTFDERITVPNVSRGDTPGIFRPRLELDIGGEAKTADYQNHRGSSVVFAYSVQAGDSDEDGISIGTNKLYLNGGVIWDAAHNNPISATLNISGLPLDAVVSHDALPDSSGHKVAASSSSLTLTGPTTIHYKENGDTHVGSSYTVSGSNADITWSLSGEDGSLFSLNDSKRSWDPGKVLWFSSPPNYEDPKDADEDNEYSVTIDASDGTNSVSFKVVVVVTNDFLDSDEVPVIIGTPQVGETLTADASRISDPDDFHEGTFAYGWMRIDGTTETWIDGTEGSTYTLTAEDKGKRIKVVATGLFGYWSAGDENRRHSEPTAVVTAPGQINSPASGQPTITGSARVGFTLTADTSGVSDDDGLDNATFSYQWLADDADISGATSSTYTLVATDEGKAVKVSVSFTDDAGYDETLTSEATAAVAGVATDPPPAPTNLAVSDNGNGTLTLTWDAPDDDSVTGYQILRRRPNEGEKTLLVYVADTGSADTNWTDEDVTVGTRHVYRVKANNAVGLSQVSSHTGATPASPPANIAATGAPTITGTAQVGETLTAGTSGISDDNGLNNATFSYQWLADDEDISGATSSTYTLAAADAGKAVKVRVSFTDDAGHDETLTSGATAAVAALQPDLASVWVVGINTASGVYTGRTFTLSAGLQNDGAGPSAATTLRYYQSSDATIDTSDTEVGTDDVAALAAAESASESEELTAPDTAGTYYYGACVDAVAGESDTTNNCSSGLEVAVLSWNSPATGAATITGKAQVGKTLRAGTSGISDDDGLDNAVFSYQWLADDTEMSGATSSAYTLVDADKGKAVKVKVSFTDDAGNDETVTSTATDAVAATPLTVSFENEATSHDGSGSFTFELRFSEEVKLGYKSLRDHVFTVTGGTVTKAQRLDKPSNTRWQITVQPDSNADVTVVLPVTTDCDAQGAVCTKNGGRPLSNTISVTVQGPAENSPASGQPTISGTAQVGETLAASTSGISDADGVDNAAFSYQWLADDAEISGATDNNYTLVDDDEGKAVKVRVSFTDDAGNDESLTSTATAAVAAAPVENNAATGAPMIRGTARVGETLTARTSRISDGDGLTNATFSYQWLADDADISGATSSAYTLVEADKGKAIKVRVSFTDDAGNDESQTSAATSAVAAALPPPAPTNLVVSDNGNGTLTLTWDAPDDDSVTGYQILRRRPNEGESTLLIQVADTGSTDTTWTDEDVTIGTQHVYRVKAINAGGLSQMSSLARATPASPPENNAATGAPTITGTAQVGETLTAATSGITDADGLDSATFTYQWMADDADISGATDNNYTLAVADEGKAVKVQVSFTDDAGHAETLTSAATAAVAAAAPPAVSSIKVDGATVTVTFDEDLAPVSSVETLHLYWTISGTAVDQHPNRASVSGRTVTLEIGSPAVAGQTITVSYESSGHLKDADGNAVESFSVTATNLTQ